MYISSKEVRLVGKNSPKYRSASRLKRTPRVEVAVPADLTTSDLLEEVRQLRAALKLYQAIINRLLQRTGS